ncbi:MAG TPA: hypothetical protein VGU20_29515 [Stellaceae bacterium]|nr:hypothetical protein [Stellaceae bacterium]
MSQGDRRFLLGLAILPWLALAGAPSFAAETSATVDKSGASVAACQKAAEHEATAVKGWNSVEWTEAQHENEAKTRIALSGRARTATGWTAFTARCELDKRHRATATLDPEPPRPSRARTLDLSPAAAIPPPKPARTVPLAPALSDRSTDESSGSSQVKGTLSEIRPDIPTAPLKKQDFFHDHRLGIKIETPF